MVNIVLHTEDLSIGYQNKKAQTIIASEVGISLKKGTLTSLIGANGIGKSTLLRTITGIQKPIAGRVFLAGKNISKYNSAELARQLSLVLTEQLPPSNLTVSELVALGRQPYTNWIGTLSSEDKIKIKTALEATATGHLSERKHFELSDGQFQKVLIARALAQDTPVIILDEPTTHLDLEHKFSMFTLLKKLAVEADKSILFSTHDIDLAIQLSDEMIVMDRFGIQQNTPQQFIENRTFDNLFPDNSISFDAEKVKFVFKDPKSNRS
ncbi:MAG TPA: ABC transporter ATP-binding protein [Flavobacterium sp.]|jgi:iron complex transport system ATP-binding protein